MDRGSFLFSSFVALFTLPVYREDPGERCDGSEEMPVTRICRESQMLILRPAAARAALPRVPIAKRFELLLEAGFFHENIEFAARKTLAERFGAVGDSPG